MGRERRGPGADAGGLGLGRRAADSPAAAPRRPRRLGSLLPARGLAFALRKSGWTRARFRGFSGEGLKRSWQEARGTEETGPACCALPTDGGGLLKEPLFYSVGLFPSLLNTGSAEERGARKQKGQGAGARPFPRHALGAGGGSSGRGLLWVHQQPPVSPCGPPACTSWSCLRQLFWGSVPPLRRPNRCGHPRLAV